MALRQLKSAADYEQCLELQRLTWGTDFQELVPPTIVRISQKVGAIAAGAFDDADHMLGFVYGITGLRRGRLANWSHMLAVRPEARGLGLGRDLKLFQRRCLLDLGVEVVYWTYDPLVAINANLNLNRLGARPDEYVVDMYGRDTGSELHSGLGTDRFIVAWELASPQVVESLEHQSRQLPEGPSTGDVVLRSPGLEARDVELAKSAERVWVEIPADIEQIKAASVSEARTWREGTRAALSELMGVGFVVDAFARSGDLHYAYRLARRPLRAPQTDDHDPAGGAPDA